MAKKSNYKSKIPVFENEHNLRNKAPYCHFRTFTCSGEEMLHSCIFDIWLNRTIVHVFL